MQLMQQQITDELLSLANPEIAEHSQRFFKTGIGEYGYGDKFLGIRVPVIRQVVKRYKTASIEVAEQLLASEYHEIRLFALLLLVARFVKGSHTDQQQIFRVYFNNIQYVNNWDLVDSSAPAIVGGYLSDKDRTVLYDLLKSDSLWQRRIAIIATLYFIKQNDFVDTLQIAEQLLTDKEDLIHKAVGWMLREMGKRELAMLVQFLEAHYQQMLRTMLRYAIERLPMEQRQYYLIRG